MKLKKIAGILILICAFEMNTASARSKSPAAPPDERTRLGMELKDAAFKGDLARVELLLSQGADPNFRVNPSDYRTATFWSVMHGEDQILRKLIEKGGNVNDGEVLTSYNMPSEWKKKLKRGPLVVAMPEIRNLPLEVRIGEHVYRTNETDFGKAARLADEILAGHEFSVLASDYQAAQGCKLTLLDLLMDEVARNLEQGKKARDEVRLNSAPLLEAEYRLSGKPVPDSVRAREELLVKERAEAYEKELKGLQRVFNVLYDAKASCGTCEASATRQCRGSIALKKGATPREVADMKVSLPARATGYAKVIYENGRLVERAAAGSAPLPSESKPSALGADAFPAD